MTRTLSGAVVVALLASHGALAQARLDYAVVVHVQNDAAIPSSLLLAAEQAAGNMFKQVGIELRWQEPAAPERDGTREPEVSIVLMSRTMAAKKSASDHIADGAVATSSQRTGRAYVFCERVSKVAHQHAMAEGQVLAHVFTHELGHMIADIGHETIGVMRGTIDTTEAGFFGFTEAQRRAIRDALAIAMATDAPRLALRVTPKLDTPTDVRSR